MRLLLIVSGSVAAFKSLAFVRLARAAGHEVQAILTAGGARFVTREALAAITGRPVHQDLWAAEESHGHIPLARWPDAVLAAPASANLLSRMAHGMTTDLASTVLLATRAPVWAAPAMNPAMWEHAATMANVAVLRARGVRFAGPVEGAMAEPETGAGRFIEPADLLALLAGPRPLAGRHALVTSGPTHEPIDPVRYIANRSSGRQGHAIAAALAALGARVTLVSGPVAVPDPAGVTVLRVETARQMLAACAAALPADVFVAAAAVADWRTSSEASQKMKKVAGSGAPLLEMVLNPDILATLSAHDLPSPGRPRLVVGFAAETETVVEHAQAKRLRKGCDWIVANDVSGDVMGGADNTVHLVRPDGVEHWPRLPKEEVALRLAARIAEALA